MKITLTPLDNIRKGTNRMIDDTKVSSFTFNWVDQIEVIRGNKKMVINVSDISKGDIIVYRDFKYKIIQMLSKENFDEKGDDIVRYKFDGKKWSDREVVK